MKKAFRLLFVMLSLVMLAIYLSSCSLISIFKGISDGLDDKESESNNAQITETETVPNDTIIDIIETEISSNDMEETQEPEITTHVVIKNIEDYMIVRPDLASAEVKNAVMDLKNIIKNETGASLELSDYSVNYTYEILIGDLMRSESQKVKGEIRPKDYLIRLDGHKIIITGGCDESLIAAINKFKELFIVEGKVIVPTGKGFISFFEYPLESISIKGKPISEYKIYSTNKECSSKLSDIISKEISGQVVKVADKMTSNDSPYIILKPTSMNYTHYDVELDGNNLIVSGSYKSCSEFLDYFINKSPKIVNITEKFSGDIDAPVLYSKEELMYVLETVYEEDSRLIIGQEANGNIKTPYAGSIELFNEATWEYPGIVGIDLSWAGMCLYDSARGQRKATDELKSQIFCEMVEYAEMGGIFTIGSHFLNPNRNGYANLRSGNECRGYLGNDDAFKEVITPGTNLNSNFKAELDACTEWLKYLQEIGLPVIFRPFHEMNMSSRSFWWCLRQVLPDNPNYYISTQSFVDLWIYVYNLFNEAGLDNLLWHYCPDTSGIDIMRAYPGDEYCDLVGADWYTSGRLEILSNYSQRPLKVLMSAGKPIGIGEMGHWNVHSSSMDYVDDLKEIFKSGGKLAYAMVWTSDHSFLNLGDGKEAMATGMFIDRDELLNKYFPAARAALGN